MFNATTTKNTIAAALKKLGMQVTITSAASGSNTKTYGVFDEDKKTSDTTNPLSLTSEMTTGTLVCYITAIKTSPQPGDDLTGKGHSHNIKQVEAYKPAATVIGYKLTLE